MSEGLKL